MLTPFLFISGLCDCGNNQSRDKCGRNSRRSCAERSGQYSEPALLADHLFRASGERVAESRQRNGCAASCEVNEGLIKPDRLQRNAEHNEDHEYPRRRYIRCVNESLTDNADQPSD